MNRLDFIEKIKEQNITLEQLDVVIGEKTNVPFSTGCYENNGEWHIYNVGERQNFVITATGKEEEIFDKMYKIVIGKVRLMERRKNN